MTLAFEVDAAGAASAVTASGLDAEVASCLVEVVRRPDFVVTPGTGSVQVALNFRAR